MAAIVNDTELVLYGTVGDMFWEESFTARDVVAALAQTKGKDITVRLNSGGGIADEGVAIYNSLKAHKGAVTVYVDGIAASAASIIAMAGSKIVMRTGSVMMIHDPLVLAMGNADDMQKSIEALNAIGDSMADIYAAKTGRKAADIRAEMKEELWLTPADAKAKGYADDEDDGDAVEASAFDYRAYAKAPERIYALSDTKAWSNRLRAKAQAPQPKEPQMADTVTKEAAAAQAEAAAKDAADKAVKDEQERAADIVAMCAKDGLTILASKMIRDGSTIDQAKAKIEAEGSRITAIKAKVDAAKASLGSGFDVAAETANFIAIGASVEAVGSALLDKIVAKQEARPTRSALAAASAGADDGKTVAPNANSIYANRQQARSKMAVTQ